MPLSTVFRIRPWLRWLHVALSQHVAFLMSQRHLDKELAELKTWLDSRNKNFEQLLTLHGKFQLLVQELEMRCV